MMRKQVRIVGIGHTKLGRLNRGVADLATEALDLALKDAGIPRSGLHGLVAVPSLASPHFMHAHYLATVADLFHKNFIVRTVDTGGAGPVSAIATGANIIASEWAETVAIVASDAVLSLSSKEFLRRADGSVEGGNLPSPCIPNGYDKIAQWHMKRYGLTREQLAMVSSLMSWNAARHPDALCRSPHTLDEVLKSPKIGSVTNLLECARRADGAAAVILSSSRHYKRTYNPSDNMSRCPVLISTGEASGPLYPPERVEDITPEHFPCERAASLCYEQAQLGANDIDFWGLYDCFPICFLRALEAVNVVPEGKAGDFIEDKYHKMVRGELTVNDFPFNTHGGLQAFGAPWEVPAMFNVLEAVQQLRGEASGRQVTPKPKRALVYGNGGIFSSAAVAILGSGQY
eukprot:PhM_4_TR17987/c0_g2_i1/m.63430